MSNEGLCADEPRRQMVSEEGIEEYFG